MKYLLNYLFHSAKYTVLIFMVSANFAFAQNTRSSESSASSATQTTSNSSQNSSQESSLNASSTPGALTEAQISKDNALLAAALKALAKEDEIEWIESDQDKIIALYKASEVKVMKGNLWILHSPDAPSAWPASLEILRRNLPLFGWSTFALPLPTKKLHSNSVGSNSSTTRPLLGTSSASVTSSTSNSAASSSQAASSSEVSSTNTSSAESSPTAEASSVSSTIQFTRENIIAQRLEAGFVALQAKGQFNLVTLVDNSNAVAVLANPAGKSAQAIILVNLQNQEPLSKAQLKEIFSNTTVPLMDVFFDPDDVRQSEQRRNHRAEAMRQKLKDYQQVIMPSESYVNLDNSQSFWLQKVRGFMDKKAEGEEAKRATKK